ncbi:AraC family transcriptional regulator [Litoreibacter roseus]|uniref:Transcriptional regulator n=1 Tax=Litoreibacter roseus TaxID=2601869 RepID=A0A6N6JL73_9RHOB|nr:AraC family transcriptional regulator [Litoreibacter roseus]GFE66805.1 transcriptional regulator [Litoreibacter roseus]
MPATLTASPTLPRIETLAAFQRCETWRSDTARTLPHPILFWITRGQGRFMVDCKMRGVGPHTAVFLPAHTLFSYEMFAQPQGMVISLPDSEGDALPQQTAVLRSNLVQHQTEISALIDAIVREIGAKTDQIGRDRALRAHVMLLGVWLDRLLAEQPPVAAGKSEKTLRQFSHVVGHDPETGKSLSDFAAEMQITPTHLTRLTQGSVGKPASALVTERVINAACDALVHTNTTVREIAEQLGFSSPAYFTRAFQTQTGKNPTDFRKANARVVEASPR